MIVPPSTTTPYASSADHLRDELARIGGLLRAQLLRFRLSRPEADRERFWHLTDSCLDAAARDAKLSPLDAVAPTDDVRALIDWSVERRVEIAKRIAATKSVDLRLMRLAREFALRAEDLDALLVALLPAMHSTYRHLLGVLQHDPVRSHATVGLVIEMLAVTPRDRAQLHARLSPAGRLVGERLLSLSGNDEEPLVTRTATVDERVVTYLLGHDVADARIAQLATEFDESVDPKSLPLPPETLSRLEMLPNLRVAEPELMPHLRLRFSGPDPDLAIRAFASVAAGLQRRVLLVDLDRALNHAANWPLLIDLILREARLTQSLPMFTGLTRLLENSENASRLDYFLRRLDTFSHPAAVETATATPEAFERGAWIPFHIPAPGVPMRERLWRQLLATEPNGVTEQAQVAASLARAFQFTASQIRDGWQTARGLARHRNVFIASVEEQDLYAACRQQSAQKLVSFAQRIEPRPKLTLEKDIVLPPASKRLLGELRARIRHHASIHARMGLGDHMRLGRGVIAMFVGGSGTGKTMAAEVLASDQQLDLYRIDLSSMVSKWVGETEKNLARVFADAERANCMLFFDEADAIFGRRGQVKDAQDRWAGLEVNYLLQRIEEYSGVVILATNLRQNMDDAFNRRIHVIVDFPVPDATSRRAIWERLLPRGDACSVSPGEIDEIAQRFELTGGNIRNVVLDACFRAAEDDGRHVVTSRHLVASAARELQKLSRPVTRGEFGRFYDWAMQDVIAPQDLAGSA